MITKPLFALLFAMSAENVTTKAELTVPALTLEKSDKVDFSVAFDGVTSDYRILTTSVMPGDVITFETAARLSSDRGDAEQLEKGWRWSAPETPGHYELSFRKNGQDMLLNVFVLTPFRNGVDESLKGYRIGQYSNQPLRGLPQYLPPPGFIDMQPGMEDIQVAPNFRLGQFICKQQPGHDPTFLLIQPALLMKLETLLEAANEKGWEADTLYVMSGFRTPFYNAAIGNTTTSSRHLFGDAADVYIDNDGDGNMDDLDGDGKVTRQDAIALADLAKSIANADIDAWASGGIGIYGANAAHGPFIHIDARGYPARWG